MFLKKILVRFVVVYFLASAAIAVEPGNGIEVILQKGPDEEFRSVLSFSWEDFCVSYPDQGKEFHGDIKLCTTEYWNPEDETFLPMMNWMTLPYDSGEYIQEEGRSINYSGHYSIYGPQAHTVKNVGYKIARIGDQNKISIPVYGRYGEETILDITLEKTLYTNMFQLAVYERPKGSSPFFSRIKPPELQGTIIEVEGDELIFSRHIIGSPSVLEPIASSGEIVARRTFYSYDQYSRRHRTTLMYTFNYVPEGTGKIFVNANGVVESGDNLKVTRENNKNFITLSYKEVTVFKKEFHTISDSWHIKDRYSQRYYEYAPFILGGRWGFTRRSQEGEVMWFTGNMLQIRHRVRGGVQIDPPVYYFDLLHEQTARRKLRQKQDI